MTSGPLEPSRPPQEAADADRVEGLPDEALDEVAGGLSYTDPIEIPP